MLFSFFKFTHKIHLIVSLEKANYKISGNPDTEEHSVPFTRDFMLHKFPVNTEIVRIKSYRVQVDFLFLCNVCGFLKITENFVHVSLCMYVSHFNLFSIALNSSNTILCVDLIFLLKISKIFIFLFFIFLTLHA